MGAARDAVRRASRSVSDPFTKAWLFDDDKGTWESLAETMIAKGHDVYDVSAFIAYTALSASLRVVRAAEKNKQNR